MRARSELSLEERRRVLRLARGYLRSHERPLGKDGLAYLDRELLAIERRLREPVHLVRDDAGGFSVDGRAVAVRGDGLGIAFAVFDAAARGHAVPVREIYPTAVRPDVCARAALKRAAAALEEQCPQLAAEIRSIRCEDGRLVPRVGSLVRVSSAFQITESAAWGASVGSTATAQRGGRACNRR